MQQQNEPNSLAAVLEELNERTLPRLTRIREKLEHGETVGETELNFFSTSLEHLQQCFKLYPDDEAQRIFARLTGLFEDAIEQSLANEKRARDDG